MSNGDQPRQDPDDAPPKTVESRVRSQIIMVDPVEGAPFLLAEFTIDCPFCGAQRIQIAGHHMRLIRDVLIQAIDDYPALTQVGAQIIEQYTITGPGNDPGSS